ncbi:hypothetical protein [Thermomonospora amylolytica]|uniref:hypothetical protein n=1 Tax=Thermomonospora amylolytica TaxID=1411117 RepID=UPI000E6BA017|nr:hypothetical protein [Thermomonospora amylolytica]
MTQSPPSPRDARTAAEYVGRARCLKAWSGLSYRELSRRAAANGDHLPPSTLATALRRTSLPAEPLIAAFVRACGCDPATVAEWTAARRRIAMAAENALTHHLAAQHDETARTAAHPPQPARPGDEDAVNVHRRREAGWNGLGGPALPSAARRRSFRGRGRARLVGAVAVGVVTVLGATGSSPGDRDGRSGARIAGASTAGPLADGWYRIHTAGDGRCLGVADGDGEPPVVRQDCRVASGQRFHFRHVGRAAYRIRGRRPRGGSGCLSVDGAPDAGGLRLRECSAADPGQLLAVRVLPGEDAGRLRVRGMAGLAVPVIVRAAEGDGLRFYLSALDGDGTVR